MQLEVVDVCRWDDLDWKILQLIEIIVSQCIGNCQNNAVSFPNKRKSIYVF